MSGLTIPCVTPAHILHDLSDMVVTSPNKVTKRLNRLRVVCRAMKIDPEAWIATLKLAEEKNMTITLDEINEYITREQSQDYEETIEFGTGDVDDRVKKTIEAALTAGLNRDLTLYKITTGVMRRIWSRICKHYIFAPLVKSRDLLLVHKGGIAQRLVLLQHFPELSDEIKQYFGFGGDNDVNLLLNPAFPEFESYHKVLVEFVHANMLSLVGTFSNGNVATLAKKVKTIRPADLVDLDVVPAMRNHFKIYDSVDGNHLGYNKGSVVSYMDTSIVKSSVVVSNNDTLMFHDEVGRLAHFTLLRYKQSFRVGTALCGAELLDIAIPHRDEAKMINSYHHYKSGQWVSDLDLSNF